MIFFIQSPWNNHNHIKYHDFKNSDGGGSKGQPKMDLNALASLFIRIFLTDFFQGFVAFLMMHTASL